MRFCLLRCQFCCRHRARAYVLLTLRGEGPSTDRRPFRLATLGKLRQCTPKWAAACAKRLASGSRAFSKARPHLRLVVDMFLPDAARLIRTHSENTLFQFLETNREFRFIRSSDSNFALTSCLPSTAMSVEHEAIKCRTPPSSLRLVILHAFPCPLI